jgi:hypothetical protein
MATKKKDRNEKARERMQRESMNRQGLMVPEVRRASIDDLVVRRNAEGKVEPIEATSMMLGMSLLIRPVLYREVMKMDLTAEATDWAFEDQVALVANHVVEPDLSGLTVDEVRHEWDPFTFSEIVRTVVLYSGPLRKRWDEEKKAAGMTPEEESDEGN